MLEKYTARARTMTDVALKGALKDVRETLEIYKDEYDPHRGYAAKLWAEFDAYTGELQRRGFVL